MTDKRTPHILSGVMGKCSVTIAAKFGWEELPEPHGVFDAFCGRLTMPSRGREVLVGPGWPKDSCGEACLRQNARGLDIRYSERPSPQ